MSNPKATYILVAVAAVMFTIAAMLQLVSGLQSPEVTTFNYVSFGLTVIAAVALNAWLIVLTRRRRYDPSSF